MIRYLNYLVQLVTTLLLVSSFACDTAMTSDISSMSHLSSSPQTTEVCSPSWRLHHTLLIRSQSSLSQSYMIHIMMSSSRSLYPEGSTNTGESYCLFFFFCSVVIDEQPEDVVIMGWIRSTNMTPHSYLRICTYTLFECLAHQLYPIFNYRCFYIDSQEDACENEMVVNTKYEKEISHRCVSLISARTSRSSCKRKSS